LLFLVDYELEDYKLVIIYVMRYSKSVSH